MIGSDTSPGPAHIHAFDLETGRQRWAFPVGRGVLPAIVGSGGTAYAATTEHGVLALDVASGKVRWSARLSATGWERTALSGERIFTGASDGFLYALNARTGATEWRTSLGDAVSTTVTVLDDAVYAGTADGMFHRLDRHDGKVLAARKLDDKLRPRGSLAATRTSLLVLLTDEAADYRALVSVDAALNGVVWRQQPPDRWQTSRAHVWRNHIVLGTPTGEVLAYRVEDGAPAWSRTVRGRVRAIGSSSDTLYAGTTEGTLYALPAPEVP